MKPSIKQEIKICCICSIEEANEALKSGANAIGLVANMPSGPGIITDEKISDIVNNLPQSVNTFLLTSFTKSREIIQHHQMVKTKTIQIVDELTEGTYEDIRNAINGIKLVQVIHVIDENTIDQAIKVSKHVDAILLDSGNPNSKIKTLGGTGKTHNWGISKIIREEVNVPIYLAGGLTPENVKDAINIVNPFGVDVCSGVRTNCKLDKEKLTRFISAVRSTVE